MAALKLQKYSYNAYASRRRSLDFCLVKVMPKDKTTFGTLLMYASATFDELEEVKIVLSTACLQILRSRASHEMEYQTKGQYLGSVSIVNLYVVACLHLKHLGCSWFTVHRVVAPNTRDQQFESNNRQNFTTVQNLIADPF